LPSSAQTQAANDGEREVRVVYYAFDFLHLDGRMSRLYRSSSERRFLSRRSQICPAFSSNGHETSDGEVILGHAGKLGFEGVVSKTIDAGYAPGNRGLWRKAKWLNRQEFVIVGWSDPEGTRPHLGALGLLQ
jgi:ATP-dependent DNA ligase